jgi:hypothetical protein
MVAVSNRQRNEPADTLLLSKRGAQLLQQSVQPTQHELIIDFIWIQAKGTFERGLCDRWMYWGRIDSLSPIVQQIGGHAEDGLQVCQRNNGNRAECEEVQILQSLQKP